MSHCRAIYSKARTCYLIQPLHTTLAQDLFVTKWSFNKTRKYCTFIKNEKDTQKVVNISKMNDVNVQNPQSDIRNMTNREELFKTYLNKESDRIESESNMDTPDNTSRSMNAVLHKDLHAMYPNPINTVHQFYNMVCRELNDNSVLNVHYKNSTTKLPLWKCTYSVTWPVKEKFIAYGASKSVASTQAALKCLHKLHSHGKIEDMKFKIYNDNEVQDKLHTPIPIDLKLEHFKEVEKLLEIYKMDIENIINNSKLYVNTSNFTQSNKYFIYDERFNSFAKSITRNKQLQDRLLLNNTNKKNKENTLPIFEYRDEILEKLENNQVIIIKGDTGCGKTTQVPQFIMDSFIEKGNATDCNILISQPRRISATSLAERVSYERNETLGDVVGYYVRLESVLPQFPGGMLFCTTGILRQLIQSNPNLTGYSHVILDEAHERSLDIDVLLVLLKRIMENNPTIKIIVMSATINTDLFQKYFNCGSIEIPCRMYPVRQFYKDDFQRVLPTSRNEKYTDNGDYESLINYNDIANLIKWIFETKPPGTILCFLPGWQEIMVLNHLLKNMKSIADKMLLLPLHSKLANINQRKIFQPAQPNITKVILATDIAETGITVPDVVYVVDSAVKNIVVWDDRKFSYCMNQEIVSKANIHQRKGRAGRTQPGESYHFVTKEEYDYLKSYSTPAILSSSLDETIVEMKTYTNEKVEKFCNSMLQPPNPTALYKAVNRLKRLNIIDANENFTPLGKLVSQIPMHPTLSKALVLSTIFQCPQPMLYISAIHSTERDFFSSFDKSAKRTIKMHYHNTSDYLATTMLFSKWKKASQMSDYESDIFSNEMGLSPSKLKLLAKICDSYLNHLKQCNLLEEQYYLDDSEMLSKKYQFPEEIIHGIILASTNKLLRFSTFGYVKGVFKKKLQVLSENNRIVDISNQSVNYRRKDWPSPFAVYIHGAHLHKVPAMKVDDCGIISPLTMLLFNQDKMYYEPDDNGDSGNIVVNVGNKANLYFACTSKDAHLLMSFRDVIWSMVDYFIKERCSQNNSTNELYCMEQYMSKVLDVLSKISRMHNTKEQ